MTLLRPLAALLALCLLPFSALAQSPYSPAITVNDDAISFYEIEQRIRMLELFNTPGDLPALAREQLIDDRLKLQELARAGLRLSDEALLEQMEAFAGRANLPYDQFIGQLAGAGVAEETLRDFIRVGVSWRDYIRGRYRSQSAVSEAEVDRAINRSAGTGSEIEVLLNEIIIPAPPQQAAQAEAVARNISRMRSTGAFESAAREYSALPSKDRGGRVDWTPVNNYPGPIAALLLDLSPGEVTQPLPIPNGIALFQLRAVREVRTSVPAPALIDYALLYLPAGDRTEARRLRSRVDTCDDLYGIARTMPPEQLVRSEVAPAEIPRDIALELAKLDPGEVSTNLVRGDTQYFLMMCRRTPALEGGVDREATEGSLRSQRLSGFADVLLAQLRSAATIRNFE
ncbi:peptidylprolyl isomerase [Roseisalinus antarcticus]|uniref:Parvulin-like PPIase n=1 Tax=Roseisalinus antarcticus TaxID=254357 RepID=A0A1Y5RIA8_9RHOB|nr:peptidylprolyl isomerase [Roseisalinus antarcticus]SLN18194.1 Chaperone SurA precursor [Roseisalinus antarcticus]